MVTTNHVRTGLIILLVVALLVFIAVMYWQQAFHVNTLHLLADDPFSHVAAGC